MGKFFCLIIVTLKSILSILSIWPEVMLVKGNTNFESFIVVIFFNTHRSKSDLCAAVPELPVHWRELSKISQDWAVLLRHEKQNTHNLLGQPEPYVDDHCAQELSTAISIRFYIGLDPPCLLRFPPSTELSTSCFP